MVQSSEESHNNEEEKKDLELPFFDLSTILNATGNFSIENKIGEGGFGPVYKVRNKMFLFNYFFY